MGFVQSGGDLIAPSLLHYEVANGLGRYTE
jgi:hypothetical protein